MLVPRIQTHAHLHSEDVPSDSTVMHVAMRILSVPRIFILDKSKSRALVSTGSGDVTVEH